MAYTVWIDESEGWNPHEAFTLDDILGVIAQYSYGKDMSRIRITKDVELKIVEGEPAPSPGLVFPPGVRSITRDGTTHTLHTEEPPF